MYSPHSHELGPEAKDMVSGSVIHTKLAIVLANARPGIAALPDTMAVCLPWAKGPGE
jgi:diacylglycerol kinase